ncbi:MAG TPA: phosphotransferase [Variovorax sp.]
MSALPLPPAAQAERLTDALRRSGALGAGQVRQVEVISSRPQILSHITRLRLSYAGGDAGPSTLILKSGLPQLDAGGWAGGRHEVAFYAKVAPSMPAQLLPACHEALWNPETNGWHLILEDLSDSHLIATAWPLPPDIDACERIARARAHQHAVWWDHPELGRSIGEHADDRVLGWPLADFAAQYGRFAEQAGDILSTERRQLFERLIAAAPRLLHRKQSRRQLSLVHGDAHVWNVFLPRDDAANGVRLFDWDCWRIDVGAADLAYMMAMHWYPELRRRWERRLLDAYHAALLGHGVRDYSRADLEDDYRLCVLWHLSVPVRQAIIGIPPVIWWNNLGRILLAADDLDCGSLL